MKLKLDLTTQYESPIIKSTKKNTSTYSFRYS